MDQPISCQDICHIYKHPLSILIHLKYQDKDGCSKNGSRELLFNLRLKKRDGFDRFLRYYTLDTRGVPLELEYDHLPGDKNNEERIILGFKQLKINIKSQFPIVQEEREAMTYLLKKLPGARDLHEIDDILDNPTLGGHSINSVCGHVIGIYNSSNCQIDLTVSNHSQVFSSLTQLQHLRSLSFMISENWRHQDQFYEELGDQLGSKLVHLGIRATDWARSLELLSNQMFKFSFLKKLKLGIYSKAFNPSFVLFNSYLILC